MNFNSSKVYRCKNKSMGYAIHQNSPRSFRWRLWKPRFSLTRIEDYYNITEITGKASTLTEAHCRARQAIDNYVHSI